MGVKKPWDLYTWLCPPGFFDSLPPIEGAVETLHKLSKDHELVIITKPLEWSCCTQEKFDWLTRHLVGIPYKLIMVDSMETKGLVGADVIIDDDPRVLKSLRLSTGILVRCPWNESDVRDYTEVISSITEVIPIIERMQTDLEIY
jgi:5'(3')-deoxyribonucleotidase